MKFVLNHIFQVNKHHQTEKLSLYYRPVGWDRIIMIIMIQVRLYIIGHLAIRIFRETQEWIRKII